MFSALNLVVPRRLRLAGVAACFLIGLLALSSASRAKEPMGPLFDRFSLKLSGAFASLDTTIRADDKTGSLPGTEINFESDLGVSDSSFFGELRFQFFLGRRHRLGFIYDRDSRSGVEVIATEIRFEDVVFPIDAELESSFRSENIGASYTYFFKHKERTAIGATLALVIGKYKSTLSGVGRNDLEFFDITVETSTEFPQPQLGFELRQMVGQNWRFIAFAGGLVLNLEDINGSSFDGSLFNGNVSIEHLTFKYASFGGGIFASMLDATLEDDDDRQQIDTNALGGQIFVRLRMP